MLSCAVGTIFIFNVSNRSLKSVLFQSSSFFLNLNSIWSLNSKSLNCYKSTKQKLSFVHQAFFCIFGYSLSSPLYSFRIQGILFSVQTELGESICWYSYVVQSVLVSLILKPKSVYRARKLNCFLIIPDKTAILKYIVKYKNRNFI